MLIPVCGERLPAKVELSIISARGLPVMNKSINSTDAFVEIRFQDENEKTDVITSLDPVWNSEYFVFESDEKELCEETVEFRVMDHDTYSANDAVGRVVLDCNLLVQTMRHNNEMTMQRNMSMPIWDTICGVRGHLLIGVRITLTVTTDYSYYVQFMSGHDAPSYMQITEIVGLVSTVRVEKDPETHWIDRIRTPRTTNETRQAAMRSELRMAAIEVAEKAHKAGASLVLGYQEYLDIEGSPTEHYCVRTFGTAIVAVPKNDFSVMYARLTYPVLSINILPSKWSWGTGPLVSARTVIVMEESDHIEAQRKKAWTELRNEIFQQALSFGCNAVIGYYEEMVIHEGLAIMSCMGTAVKYGPYEESDDDSVDTYSQRPPHPDRPDLPCVSFHAAFDPACLPFPVKMHPCNWCKNELCTDTIISTATTPEPAMLLGQKNFIQVSIARKLNTEIDDEHDAAAELSNLLPTMDRDMLNALISEGKAVNAQGNGFFEVRQSNCIAEGVIVCVMTAVLVRLVCLQKDDPGPAIPSVLSIASLQRHNDSRRFSWGSVREAIRSKTSQAPAITIKILHLKRILSESVEEESRKKSLLTAIVGIIKKSKNETHDYLAHCIMERQVSLNVGVIESGLANNANNVAGIHTGPPLMSYVLNRDQAHGCTRVGRWRQIYIKEDNSGQVRDTSSTDDFVSSTLEECLSLGRGALATTAASAFCAFDVSSSQLQADKEQAQLILLLSSDLVIYSS